MTTPKSQQHEPDRYAGLSSNPYFSLAQKYLPSGAGSILTFGIKGGQAAGVKFIESAEFLSHLANVGDAKTLIIHPASTTHRQLSEEEQIAAGVSPDMIRISVGLETLDAILWDIHQALQASHRCPRRFRDPRVRTTEMTAAACRARTKWRNRSWHPKPEPQLS